ncbi:hypothetical protein XELAEV_18008247mg [Xenopus laevis]|uniref:Uncharacterized protein n=1 Tax=Xenopus laevis TaxID=8355 RepID=A0A974I559_XENLA|nr:hypothetical protein XELAEV_18008247mg [Xenopus laevis]
MSDDGRDFFVHGLESKGLKSVDAAGSISFSWPVPYSPWKVSCVSFPFQLLLNVTFCYFKHACDLHFGTWGWPESLIKKHSVPLFFLTLKKCFIPSHPPSNVNQCTAALLSLTAESYREYALALSIQCLQLITL